jgi:hypothetical protein
MVTAKDGKTKPDFGYPPPLTSRAVEKEHKEKKK